MYRATLFGAALAAMIAGPAMAQDTPPPPCSTDEYRQLDFWVGEWDARWVDAEGVEQHGHNTITRELDSCMILEQFDGRPGNTLIGRSMSIYVGRLGVWKQVWMDNSGGYLPFSGGPDEEGFKFELDRASDEAPYYRMLFRTISQDAFDWHWQQSQDEGNTWDDNWHITYTRR